MKSLEDKARDASTATMAVNLSKLSRFEMDSRLKRLVLKERELLAEILMCLKEIDRRRLYVEMGYASLFQYLTEGIGYSAGSAQRRIDAARLLSEIGKVDKEAEAKLASQIKSGSVNLAQVSLVQKASREAKALKAEDQKIFQSDAAKLTALKTKALDHIKEKSFSEAQKEVALLFEVPIKREAKSITQSDGSVRREITFTKEQEEKIKLTQERLSHSLPNQDFANFVEFLCDKVIQQKLLLKKPKHNSKDEPGSEQQVEKQALLPPARGAQLSKPSKTKNDSPEVAAIVAVKHHPLTASSINREFLEGQSSIPQRVRRSILQSQPCCQYTDPVTGKVCRSRWYLQIDHIQPRWAFGSNDLKNLQVLCGVHNRLRYREQAGISSHQDRDSFN